MFECPDDNPSIKFADILALNLHEFQRDVEEITDRAQKEAKQESVLQELENRWSAICLVMTPYKETMVPLLHLAEDDIEMLESDQLLVQGMVSGRNSFFQDQTQNWQSKLMLVSETVGVLLDIQRSWSYLEPLFMQSEEVKRELPDDAARFEDVDELVRQTLQQMWDQEPPGSVLPACQLPGLLELLNDLRARLEKCQQALKEYLDSKRRMFPRFYFVSEADLLDILSNGSNPQKIMIHLEKVFLATHTLLLEKENNGVASSMLATHFISNDSAKETISFENKVQLEGKVELYMQTILESMQLTLRGHVTRSINRFPDQNRVDWLLQKLPPANEGEMAKDNMDAAQIALLVAGIEYTRSVENTFELLSKAIARKKKGDEHVTKVIDLNPKAVSTEDLYGYMVLGTREWKDGLLSKIMRDVASGSVTDPRPKWIVLDGDLDANWIESMNSVMDDNKMLTLASNERIPLKPNMRLLFEIRNLKFATPATVSRAGILYIPNDDGFQWKSFLASWVATKGTSVQQRTALGESMNKYIEPIISFVKQSCKTIVPMQDITMVHTYLYFLDAVLDAETLRDSKKVDILSGFISVWAFGAALTITDDGTDYRKLFSEWWRSEFKHVKFPARDTVFDYWLDPNTLSFDSWRASPYFKAVQFDGSVAMSSVTVPTPETASITSWMSIMVREERPFMLCGNAGTGKTHAIIRRFYQRPSNQHGYQLQLLHKR
ncbi:Dynein heavy chain [Phytophthora palmivora]|uniref:Dynein heavy chain n=1 Tax=Phytophthora palmivora TaxID=4796 RepID=A0A2P4Y2C0_9STRA|nr:Dynein heavy chain [Phytophthora palmivora]